MELRHLEALLAVDEQGSFTAAADSLRTVQSNISEQVRQLETELGVPWKTTAVWEKISYPFLHADRIKTPTLFLGGDQDMNVPLHNGEQMYQALRSMNVDTQLIVYPGQFHGLTVPSYRKDTLQRYINWYDGHLKK